MVCALDSRSNSLGLSSGWGHCVVFLHQNTLKFTLIVHLSPPRCTNQGTREIMLGSNPAMGGVEYS